MNRNLSPVLRNQGVKPAVVHAFRRHAAAGRM